MYRTGVNLLLASLTGLWCLVGSLAVKADTLNVAVASNFQAPMQALAERFGQDSGHQLVLMAGSTGKHYAQIINGAPVDLFFAADDTRPPRLEAEGYAVPGSCFTYALGRLVLWSRQPGLVDARGEVLGSENYTHLAIANPTLAPYGAAAQAVLEARGLWQSVQARLVRGENIAQTYQFVFSGSAELGFIAASQLHADGSPQGSWWIVPAGLHAPIRQQAVIVRDGTAARQFMQFVQSPAAHAIIRAYGYEMP